jgi:hypothetical protein
VRGRAEAASGGLDPDLPGRLYQAQAQVIFRCDLSQLQNDCCGPVHGPVCRVLRVVGVSFGSL